MVALREGENGWDGYVEKQKRVQLNISARIATIIMSSERTSGSKRSAKILFSAAAAEQETEQALRPPSSFEEMASLAETTPPNEWVNRVRELDELYTKLQIVTGFTAEQLLEIFAAGYTLEKPDYSKKFAEMENLAEAAQPNEPLTMEELRESPHGKIKNSTLQSICNRANEIASRPPEVSP